MIKLGFSTIACPSYDVDQIIALAKASKLEGIEIRFLRGTVDLTSLDELSPRRIAETRRRFEDAGLKVVVIGTSVRMNSLDPAVRAQQVRSCPDQHRHRSGPWRADAACVWRPDSRRSGSRKDH